MNGIQLPGVSKANWIWNTNSSGAPEEFVLFRKEFTCDTLGGDATLRLASPCCCRIFINGKSVGFGPDAHPDRDRVFADTFDISTYLECGNNVVAILAWHDQENTDTPAIWCELEVASTIRSRATTRLGTNGEWESAPGSLWLGASPHLVFRRTAGFRHYTGTIPDAWLMPGTAGDARCWKTPDIVIPAGKYPMSIERGVLTPPYTCAEEMFFQPLCRGKITAMPEFTRVEIPGGNRAAIGYLYSDSEGEERCFLRSSGRVKLYINGELIAQNNGEIVLPTRQGWNEMQVFCTLGSRRRDVEIEFYSPQRHSNPVHSSPDAESPVGWSITRQLKMTYDTSSWLLRSDTLVDGVFKVVKSRFPDDGERLRRSTFVSEENVENYSSLSGGECVIYELDECRYGFLHVTFSAPEDAVITISAGSVRSENGLVASGGDTGADIRISGIHNVSQEYRMPLPCDCKYVVIKASGLLQQKVEIHAVSFWELSRTEFSDPGFSSSDDFLNRMWKNGINMLRRNSARVTIRSARPVVNSYLFDSYMRSLSVATLTGSSEYLTGKLRQCLDAQLENGAIPALSGGRRCGHQLPHLLFLPAWINDAYRYCTDRNQLLKWIEKLDLVREFYESLLDTECFLLRTPENWDRTASRISSIDFSDPEKYYSCLSALFCRFLLNASECYRCAGLDEYSQHCLVTAGNVANALRCYCYLPDKHLFTTSAVEEGGEIPGCDAFTNFCMLYSGVMDSEDYPVVFNEFLNTEAPYDRKGEIKSAYFNALLCETLFAIGQRKYVMAYTEDFWQKVFDAAESPARKAGEAYVAPNIFLQRNILGVRMSDNGQTTVFFRPAYDLVERASGVIPFPCGRLRVEWEVCEDGHLSVLLDANVPLKVVPEMSMEKLGDTEFQLSEQITLLRPPDNITGY